MKRTNGVVKKLVVGSAFAGVMLAAPAIGEAALGDQVLERGDSNSDVKELQDLLKSKGHFHYHTSTGYFGPITQEAVKSFQRDSSISVTGRADTATFRALGLNVKEVQSPTSNDVVLKRGSHGQLVSNMQGKLKALGHYTGKIDGIFGPLSESAVRSYQASKDLAVTGVADSRTLELLNGYNEAVEKPEEPTKTDDKAPAQTQELKIGSRGKAVGDLQERLKARGYYNYNVDGIFGPITQRAVKEFQEVNGLPSTGVADQKTMEALSQPTRKEKTSPAPVVQKPEKEASDVLQLGMEGPLVTELQSKLKDAGMFHQQPTGYFGPITEKAVKDFQQKYELPVTGVTSQEMWYVLNSLKYTEEQPVKSNQSSFSIMDLVADAGDYIGVPYTWGGNTPEQGFDCSGFLVYVFKKQDVNLPRTMAQMWEVGKPVSSPSVGDIVFFETYKSGASHGGIYIGNNKFIHSGSSSGVTISNMTSSYWKPRYLGAKRMH
ncbi:peptidoglycan-binding protein [Pseudalkalibacillus caeni]|uniref:Endopeptidase SpoIID/LytB n=1 Tax=Exobacillus caeni TaxID=2574798 RepID=A0A5R9EWJ5_9BACL|nr:peptidoglycan-binding protein [Pseudalkalibacillus caeni]TLS35602.1 endopeptidase SpoIID/LytB [Pseudalkalibacillus caeni]